MTGRPAIDDLRSKIASVTKEIIDLAGERNRLARSAGLLKAGASLPQENEEVEDRLSAEVIAECDRVGVDRGTGLKILSVLISESKRAQGIPNREPLAPLFAKALAMERKGAKLVRLDVGEPDFPPPKSVLEGCSEALFGLKTRYTESRGIPELREALLSFLARKSGFRATDEEVTVTPSGRFAVYAALSCVVSEGESAVVLDPSWPAYRDALRQLGARPLVVNSRMEDGWAAPLGEVERAIKGHTRAIVVNFPNNPTGSVASAQLFKGIVDIADDRGLTVISDEIYGEYSSKPCPSVLVTTPKKFILTSSFSKSWAMTGFRIGYAVSNAENAAKITRLASLLVTSVPEFIQWGAIKALEADADVKRNVATMKDRVEAASAELEKVEALEFVRPEGAMYLFPRLKNRGSGDAFSEKLLQNGVSVVPGRVFGDAYPEHFRISLGQPRERIVEGIRRMRDLLP